MSDDENWENLSTTLKLLVQKLDLLDGGARLRSLELWRATIVGGLIVLTASFYVFGKAFWDKLEEVSRLAVAVQNQDERIKTLEISVARLIRNKNDKVD